MRKITYILLALRHVDKLPKKGRQLLWIIIAVLGALLTWPLFWRQHSQKLTV